MAKKLLLGRADSFRAVQVPGQVYLYALGRKPTPHTRVWLEPSVLTVFPPEYILRTNPPSYPDADVITPFLAEVTFRAFSPVKLVTIHDAAGAHRVKVVSAPEPASRKAGKPAKAAPKKPSRKAAAK